MPPARTHVTVAPTSGLERAQVKWFNRLRGFGFLTRGEGTPDIFVHMETLRRFGMTELRPGQFVLVRFGPGPKGLMAAEVRPESGLARPGIALALAGLLLRIALDGKSSLARSSLATALLVAGATMFAAVLPVLAGGQDTIDIVTRDRRACLLG